MKSSDVIVQETKSKDNKVRVRIFTYKGDGDPVKYLDDAILTVMGKLKYREFIDANMDNPWVRITVEGQNNYGNKKEAIRETIKEILTHAGNNQTNFGSQTAVDTYTRLIMAVLEVA